ncbi:MAG: flagellar biosynthesis repressor FlbT [Pseudomonadota bacterium]
MKSTLKVHLKRNEKLFVNGAVLCADRKVSLEFMNNVSFLLEAHVLQQEDATTPLRQLYFVMQSILMEPKSAPFALQMFEESHARLCKAFQNEVILAGLNDANKMVEAGRVFEAMKLIRGLFPIEDSIMESNLVTAVA